MGPNQKSYYNTIIWILVLGFLWSFTVIRKRKSLHVKYCIFPLGQCIEQSLLIKYHAGKFAFMHCIYINCMCVCVYVHTCVCLFILDKSLTSGEWNSRGALSLYMSNASFAHKWLKWFLLIRAELLTVQKNNQFKYIFSCVYYK